MAFDKAATQKRYDELTAQSDKIKAKSGPMREKRDAHVQKARAEEDRLNADILKAEKGLFEIEQERAFLARGLGARNS